MQYIRWILMLGLVAASLAHGTPLAAQSAPKTSEKDLSSVQQERLSKARRLHSQAEQLRYKQSKIREALPLAREALAIKQELFGDKHNETANSLNYVGLLLKLQGDFKDARVCYEQALAIRKEVLGTKHPDTALSLNNLAVLLQAVGEYRMARLYFEQALSIRRESLGEKNQDTASSHRNLGVLLKTIGEYKLAQLHFEQALAVHRELLGEKHVETASSLDSLAALLQVQGEYLAARTHFEQALAIRKETLGLKHLDTAYSFNNLGMLLKDQGDYAGARAQHEQALAIRKELLGNDHPDLAYSLNNLGTVLRAMSDYGAARSLFEQAIAITTKAHGSNHPLTAASLNNLGLLLKMQGDYAAARDCYEQALAIKRKRLGDKHPETALTLTNLGVLHKEQGNYVAARRCYDEALAYYRESLGDKHPATASAMSKLGVLLRRMGDNEGARRHYEQSLAVQQEAYGVNHPETALSINNLGTLHQALGEYETSRRYLEQSLAIRKALLGTKHPEVAQSFFNLGTLRAQAGDFEQAATNLALGVEIDCATQDAVFAVSSETESLQLVAKHRWARSCLISVWRHTDRTADELYANLWPAQSAVFQLAAERRQALGSSLKPEVEQLYRAWLDARREVARQTLAPAVANPKQRAARRDRLQRVTALKEELERKLAVSSPEFASRQNKRDRPHTDLARALPTAAVFIDLLRYTRVEQNPKVPGEKGDSQIQSYIAFVLTHDRPVQRIDLGPAKPIETAAKQWRAAILAGSTTSAAEELRRLVWQPLAGAFPAGINTVYLMPDGPLTSLPWAALPGSKTGTVLLEEVALAIVPNGRVLMDQLEHPPAPNSEGALLAVGGVQYGVAPIEHTASPQLVGLRAPSMNEKQTLHWPELPGTADEVIGLEKFTNERPLIKLTGNEAGTARVVAELPKARWAVFATHGFFADPAMRSAMQVDEASFRDSLQGSRETVTGRNPLLLSGLVFAGANLPRPTDSWGVPQGDGGILTAEAIAGLQLSKLELAVLSACETGLGEVAGGEGTFGLQRAFHVAGCRNVVASLWKVDDEATAALMRLFYENLWQKKQPPLEALRNAQLTILQSPAEIANYATRAPGAAKPLPDGGKAAAGKTPPRTDVRRWAAFQLSGAGR
jgi:CHAT domain-containing protein/Tfp pilus assembly protein PilF